MNSKETGKKKIVLIGPVYPYKGGIAHYTSLLYRNLIKEHDVRLISYKMQYPRLLFRKPQKDPSSDVFKVEDAEFLINTANPVNIIKVAGYIKSLKADAVIMEWWHPYFAPCYRILESAMGRDIKKLFVCHNVFPHERFPLDRSLTKLVLKRGDRFILHDKSDAADLMTIKKDARYIVSPHPSYNAFRIRGLSKDEAREELKIPPGDKLLLFFGFVRPYKGLKYMLEAMPGIIKDQKDIRLYVVGSFGQDKDEYLEMIGRLGISENVSIFDGYAGDDQVEKYFAACDLVVCPYVSATQSGIVQIAYGFEKPVLATDVGGLPDVVIDKRTGYLIKAGDADAISDAVIDYYDNDREKEFAANVKEENRRFSWDVMRENIDKLMEI